MVEKHDAVTKVSKTFLGKLNEAIASELQVAVQYMWQHVQWGGVKGFAVHDELKKIAIAEMKHAEAIAERLFYLGGIPTTKPSPIFVGSTLKEMIKRDVQDDPRHLVGAAGAETTDLWGTEPKSWKRVSGSVKCLKGRRYIR